MPVPDDKRCQGTSRTTGKRCGLRAVPPSRFCFYHGAQALGNKGGRGVPKGTPKPPGSGGPPPKGSANAMTTGVATPKMPARMEDVRQALLMRYLREFENPTEIDRMSLGRAAAVEAKFVFAVADPDCPASTLDTLHRILHRELRALKATREQREQTSSGTTPAEVIAAIMVKVAERRKEIEQGARQAPRPGPAMPAPARQVIDLPAQEPIQDLDPDLALAAPEREPDLPVFQAAEAAGGGDWGWPEE